MIKNFPLTVDNKGRVTLPKNIRSMYHIEQGDILLLKFDTREKCLRISKAIAEPLNILSKYSDQEFKEGRTKNLRELITEDE